MSHAACEAVPPTFTARPERGISQESVDVERSYVEALEHILNSVEGSSSVERRKREFDDLLERYAEPGWDGEDARPVARGAIAQAYEFASALPPAFACPDISVNR